MNTNLLGEQDLEEVTDWFWSIIEDAGRNREKLAADLHNLGKEDIRRFIREFDEATYRLWDDDFLQYMDDPSEDGILDIGSWVVSQGKNYYLDIVANPHKTPTGQDIDTETNLAGVAEVVFWGRFREDI